MEEDIIFNRLRRCIEEICGNIPGEDWALFMSKLHPETKPRGSEILAQGAHAKNLWFIVNGAVRSVEYDAGHEKTYRFFVENEFFINFNSILNNRPSEYAFVAEEDCDLIRIPYADLLEVYKRSHYFERAGRILAEQAITVEMSYRRMLLNMNATQRYNHLMQLQPDIFHRFMLKHIASMLGVTPVSLSRLRSKNKLTNKSRKKN